MKKQRVKNAIANLDKVAEGIYYYTNENVEREELAKERLKTCLGCEYYVSEVDYEPNHYYRVNTKDRIKGLSGKTCASCGCVLSYKLRAKKIKKTKGCKL